MTAEGLIYAGLFLNDVLNVNLAKTDYFRWTAIALLALSGFSTKNRILRTAQLAALFSDTVLIFYIEAAPLGVAGFLLFQTLVYLYLSGRRVIFIHWAAALGALTLWLPLLIVDYALLSFINLKTAIQKKNRRMTFALALLMICDLAIALTESGLCTSAFALVWTTYLPSAWLFWLEAAAAQKKTDPRGGYKM